MPGVHSLIRRLTPDFLLDATEFGNAFYGPLGDRRSLGFVDIDELAPYVGHAGADDPVHHKASRDIFRFLGDIVAKYF